MGHRYRLLGLAAESLDLGDHVAPLGETNVVWADERAERRGLERELHDLAVVGDFAFLHPLTTAFLQHPKTDKIFEESRGAAKTDFIRILCFANGLIDERLREFESDERPGAGGKVGPIVALGGRHRGDRGGGVMRASCDHLGFAQAGFLGEIRQHLTELHARGDGLGEDVLRDAKLLQHRPSPITLTGVPALAAGDQGLFGASLAGQEPGDVVADEQELIRELEHFRTVLGVVEQLVKRVDRDRGDTGSFEDLLLGETAHRQFIRLEAAFIAIGEREREQGTISLEQDIVDAPGIAGDGLDRAELGALGEADADFAEDTDDVPAERAVRGDGTVGETVDLLHGELTGLQLAEDDAPGFGSEVDGEVIGHGQKGQGRG